MAKNFTDKKNGFDELFTQFKAAKGESAVFVGFLRSSGTHSSKDGGQGDLTVAQLAAVHEFGSSDGKIPERSFMRSSVDANAGKISKLTEKLAAQVIDGKTGKKAALGILGQFVKQLMQTKIRDGLSPPNKPATVRRKGSSKPLIDTGQLVNAIDWEVVEGKGGK